MTNQLKRTLATCLDAIEQIERGCSTLRPMLEKALRQLDQQSAPASPPPPPAPPPSNDGALLTMEEFCERNRISVSHYYKLKRDGKHPREVKAGKRRLITQEAEADWRRESESH